MELNGVGEDEIAKVVGADQALLEHLIRFHHGLAHIEDVEMTDVRSEHRVELAVHQMLLRIKRNRRHPVLALAAEEEVRDEAVMNVALGLDSGCRVFIHGSSGRKFSPVP